MDSGNSGSMHSSSAGDDDYDSRAAAAFLSIPPLSLSGPTCRNPPPLRSMFDPFTLSYPGWADPAQQQDYQNTPPAQFGPDTGPLPGPSSEGDMPVDATPDRTVPGPVKNSRKRTRASRRPPTTVLTTDTSNFRQMVQEFTGVPAPPFSAVSPSAPYSRRLDLFGQLYPFCPAAQKVVSTTNNAATSNNIFSAPYNGQLLSSGSSLGGFASSLQNQLLANQSLGSPKSTQGNSLLEMGITQDRVNASLSAFLSEGKGNGRGTNSDGVQKNNANTARNEENGINSWNHTKEI